MSRLAPATLSVAAAALALGVGVGAGPLAESSSDDAARQQARLEGRIDQLSQRADRLRDDAKADAEAFAALAGPVVDGRLDGRSVVLVATPDARAADVRRAKRAVVGAGAALTGVLTLQETYVDPRSATSPLEDLALRLVPPGVAFPDGASAIERVGTVLARAVVQRPAEGEQPQTEMDPDGAEVLAGLHELDALSFDGEPGLRAELAVVVSAGPVEDAAVAALVAALDTGSVGTVLVAPTPSAGSGAGYSTVGGLRGTAGPTALVLALDGQVDGREGSYGTGPGTSSVLPPVGASD